MPPPFRLIPSIISGSSNVDFFMAMIFCERITFCCKVYQLWLQSVPNNIFNQQKCEPFFIFILNFQPKLRPTGRHDIYNPQSSFLMPLQENLIKFEGHALFQNILVISKPFSFSFSSCKDIRCLIIWGSGEALHPVVVVDLQDVAVLLVAIIH